MGRERVSSLAFIDPREAKNGGEELRGWEGLGWAIGWGKSPQGP